MSRLARFVTRRNVLRRPVDRIEGAVLVGLFAAFGLAVVIAAMVGTHTYQVQHAATVGLRPASALLLQNGPSADSMGRVGQAEARWFVPGGGEQSGVLTTATAPDIAGAVAGARISVWLDRSGQPTYPPGDQAVMIIYSLVAGAMVAGLAGMALLFVYALCRVALDRRRLAAWESAWDRTGPRWTTRHLPARIRPSANEGIRGKCSSVEMLLRTPAAAPRKVLTADRAEKGAADVSAGIRRRAPDRGGRRRFGVVPERSALGHQAGRAHRRGRRCGRRMA
jgi:hypothetical protein